MEQRVAIVTGGLRGLGRAMALGLAKAGHRVAAVGHIDADIRARFGSLDILVNNAGLTFTYIDPARFRRPTIQRFWEVPDEIVENVIVTNYLAGDRLSRRVASAMVAQGWGRIVNVTTKLDT